MPVRNALNCLLVGALVACATSAPNASAVNFNFVESDLSTGAACRGYIRI